MALKQGMVFLIAACTVAFNLQPTAAATSAAALAASPTGVGSDPKDGKGDPMQPGRAITWGELQARCANPDQFDVQRPPQNIRIQCSDRRRSWIAGEPGQLPLMGERVVAAGVLSDKFFVSMNEGVVPFAQPGGTCLRFHEVQESFTVERAVSCAEINGMKGSLPDFCGNVLDSSKSKNGKLVERVDTGRIADTCAGAVLTEKGLSKPLPR